jgi:hypothetical protein
MKDNKQKLGEVGERIFACLMPGCDFSADKYDRVKDLELNGKTFEVKTQVRYNNENCFTIKKTQLNKCENVDFLIFVEFDKTDYIKIWHCKDTKQHERYTTSHGYMYGYDCEKMLLISEAFWPKVASSMRELSDSSLFKNKKAEATTERKEQLLWKM